MQRSSAKAKGWPLDQAIAAATGGRPYLHALGFEAGETVRADRDATFSTALRTGIYPLIEAGWNRARAERYIQDTLGVTWEKSACSYCPYALANRVGRARVLARFAAEPTTGILALELEHLAVSLNANQGLIGGRRLIDLLAHEGQHTTLDLFQQHLDALPWALYDVRRAFWPHPGDPTRVGGAAWTSSRPAPGTRDGPPAAPRPQRPSGRL